MEFAVVPGRGLEPPQPFGHQILSLARLPIPPSGHAGFAPAHRSVLEIAGVLSSNNHSRTKAALDGWRSAGLQIGCLGNR